MAEIPQKTSRNKYKLIAKAQKLSHGDLMSKVQDHMMSCSDDDCDICDMGQSGQLIDNDEDDSGALHSKGSRASKDYKGKESTDEAGCLAEKASSVILASRRLK